ncbi:translation initiation factor [Roseofilum casamattae]|uniref:Translation initiation factor n=1 Tax=Roseofilum casamattae BLCC-M143 TaxID=3022442 RepID=A0ABT7BVB4_9CYAN|nr:translation initiation factor [Roseofilum casamattae]MDJ1183123.1 translation initiation factor [Roseofilum casamattae BLCC-M143]
MASKRSSKSGDRIAYQEFGSSTEVEEEGGVEVPPQQQNLKVEVSRKGRKGKTVTIITGFQGDRDSLTALLKQLKSQCGSGGTLKEGTMEIQGDCGQKVMEFLAQKGYKVKRSGG